MAVLSVLEPSRQQAPSIVEAFQEVNPLTAMSFGIESAVNSILKGLEQRDELAAERERQEELAAQRLAQQAQAQIDELKLAQPSISQQQHLDLALDTTWSHLHSVDTVTGMQLLEEVKEELYLAQTTFQHAAEVPQFEDSSSFIGGSRLDPYVGTLTFATLPETEARSWRDPEAPLPPETPTASREQLMTMTFAAQSTDPDAVPFVEAPSPTQLDEIRTAQNERYSTMPLDVISFNGSSQDWRQAYYLESRSAA